MNKTQWALLFSAISMLALGLADNIRGPLMPELIRFFSINNSQASFTFAAASFAALVGNTSSAFFIKRITLRQLLAISMGLMTVGMISMGAAPQYEIYVVSAMVFGFSLGCTGVAQNLLIAEGVDSPKQPKAFSALHSMYGLSSLAAPYLASRAPSWFQASTVSFLGEWRSSFFLTSLTTAIVLILILLTKVDADEHIHHQQADHTVGKTPIKVMLWFAGIFATYVAMEILVSTRLALYMRTYYGYDFNQSSNYVTYFFICLLIGRLIFAIKHFSLPVKLQLNISLLLTFIFFALGLLVHPAFIFLTGLTMAPFYPLCVFYISELTKGQKRRVLTFIMGIQSICVILMHVLIGILTDWVGLFNALAIGSILIIISLICLNFHPKPAS